MSVQNFSLLDYYEVAEKFRGDVFNFNPSCIELKLWLGFDNNNANQNLQEGFKAQVWNLAHRLNSQK